MSRMQAVNLGWDLSRSGDKTAYYCRECGPSETPCRHIDAYFKSQVREAEAVRQKKFDAGDRQLGLSDADRRYNKGFQERAKKWLR